MNNETFKPENSTISGIFSCDGIYKIPNYQRQYSWTNEELEVLWSDLYEAYENQLENSCYFLGSIVVVKNGDYLELIDGQQRITTLIIMMDVLRKSFPELNKDCDAINVADIDKINSCILHGKKNRLQLQSDPNCDLIFKEKIIERKDYGEIKQPTKSEINSDNPEYKYLNTAYFFYTKFKELKAEDLDGFINYIFFKTNIIKIICTNESFAIKLFQVLNDRGLELSNADLVKAEIYGKYESDDNDGKSSFNITWNKIVENINKYDLKMDEFIVYYEYFKLKSNPKRQVIDEIKNIIKDKNPQEIMIEMSAFSKSLETVLKSTNPIIYSLKYIPWKAYVMTALTSAYHVEYPEMESLLKLMRKFFYISFVSGATLNTIKQTSFKLIEFIVDKKPLNNIENELNNLIHSKKMIKGFYEALDDEVFDEKFLKPLLLSVDYNIREKTNTTFYSIDKKLHIDHILPRAYEKDKNRDWDYIENKEEANSYLNTLGNMALLLYSKNEECENFGFKTKVRIYQGKDKEGNNKDGITSFDTTKVIISDAEKNKDYQWNVDSIKKRKTYLMNLIEDMLDISRLDIEKNNIVTEEINFRWFYNGDYYNNKTIIIKTLEDYINSNNINNYYDINQELRQIEMNYQLLIKNELSENDIAMGYAYKKININNMEIFIRDYDDTNDTINFINVLSKYYDMNIEYINDIKEEARIPITEEMVRQVYLLSKKVFSKEIIKQQAVNEMIKNGMSAGSAYIYITAFEKMMSGEIYKRYLTVSATEYFINNIINDYGIDYGKNAIKALEKNIEYLNILGKPMKKYEELLIEIKAKNLN